MPVDMTPAQALAYFDSLDPIAPYAMLGRWRGEVVPTGHYLDALLPAARWHGKRFSGSDDVHPLVHHGPFGGLFSINPALLPLGMATHIPAPAYVLPVLITLLRPVLATRKPRARLREVAFRGKVSAAMIYDAKPIIDIFRKIDEATALGLMDHRGDAAPCFFRLTKEA